MNKTIKKIIEARINDTSEDVSEELTHDIMRYILGKITDVERYGNKKHMDSGFFHALSRLRDKLGLTN